MKIPLLLSMLCFSPGLFAQAFSCGLSGEIVKTVDYEKPTNIFTSLKNDGFPMMAFGFAVSDSEALKNQTKVREYCRSLKGTVMTVVLSGQYPNEHFNIGQRLSLRHTHQDKKIWPYWPDRYYLSAD